MFKSSLKQYTYGQDKAKDPKETISIALDKLKSFSPPLLLEIFSLEEYDRINLPVFTCKVNTSSFSFLLEDTFGKGIDEKQAQASALMEIVERVSGFSFLGHLEDSLLSSYSALKDKALSLSLLLAPFQKVPQELLSDLEEVEFSWRPAFDPYQEKEVFIPPLWFHYIYGTTGWAAGNTLEEATVQALCEIIERHCISCVIEKKLSVPTIDPQTIENSLVKELLDKITQAGIEIIIKDFSMDMGVSTIAVISLDPRAPISDLSIYAAAGTHLKPEHAIIRALTELAQHRAQVIYKKKIEKQPVGPTYCFPSFKNKKDIKFLLQGKTISWDTLPRFSHPDFKVEIEYLLDLLKNQGLTPFFFDTTQDILGIPSLIAIIPQARLNRPSTRLSPFLFVAREYMYRKDYEKAIFYLEKAFDHQPHLKNSPQILSQTAICYKKAGNYEKAHYFFQSLLKKAPYLLRSPKFMKDFMEIVEHIKKNRRN